MQAGVIAGAISAGVVAVCRMKRLVVCSCTKIELMLYVYICRLVGESSLLSHLSLCGVDVNLEIFLLQAVSKSQIKRIITIRADIWDQIVLFHDQTFQ